jgi:hypothetical protein
VLRLLIGRATGDSIASAMKLGLGLGGDVVGMAFVVVGAAVVGRGRKHGRKGSSQRLNRSRHLNRTPPGILLLRFDSFELFLDLLL